jgi:hypothetical protein
MSFIFFQEIKKRKEIYNIPIGTPKIPVIRSYKDFELVQQNMTENTYISSNKVTFLCFSLPTILSTNVLSMLKIHTPVPTTLNSKSAYLPWLDQWNRSP